MRGRCEKVFTVYGCVSSRDDGVSNRHCSEAKYGCDLRRQVVVLEVSGRTYLLVSYMTRFQRKAQVVLLQASKYLVS